MLQEWQSEMGGRSLEVILGRGRKKSQQRLRKVTNE